ncbi:MAG: M48 family metallopeptidase [Agriterribacter sp.]
MKITVYPEAPKGLNESITATSPAFKQQVSKVILSIIFFLVVYIMLVVAAVALAAGCLYVGFLVIIFHPSFLTIVLGLGAAALGVSVIFFLIKFIFSVSKDENPSRVQIFEQDQPALFSFIRKLTDETQTPFPKKIFVSPDVNACVFYNSSFWSMFLPVRKNLEIGLGLVNSINVSEFKAVLAHEFGHFSQRSMKLGSFTYNVNRVIYNMLYENNGYTNFLNSWGQLNGYLSLFANLTVKIAVGIQWILRGVYKSVNKNYLALSREMEFHADAVAASVAGGNNLVTGLSRVEVAQACYNSALNKASEWLKQKKISKNIFDNQLSVFHSMAKEHQLPVRGGLPEVSYHFIESFSKSRVNYKNQWASHPTLEERKAHLDALNANCEPNEARAWITFDNSGKLQEELTGNLYKSVKLESSHETYDAAYFEALQVKEKEMYTLPAVYKGFYDKRYINISEWDINAILLQPGKNNFEEIFNDTNGQLQSSIKNNETDLVTIKAIKEKQIDTKTFDFDGNKYSNAECDNIIVQLEEDIKRETTQLAELDKNAFVLFYNGATTEAGSVKLAYQQFQEIAKEYDEYIAVANNIVKDINPFYHGNITVQQVTSIVENLKNSDERKLKRILKEILEKKIVTTETNTELHKSIAGFLEKNYTYFSLNEFQNAELNHLRDLIVSLADEWNEYMFRHYKNMLEKQLQLYNKP